LLPSACPICERSFFPKQSVLGRQSLVLLWVERSRTEGCSVLVDEKYFEVAPPGSLAERLLIKARKRIYSDFISLMRPASSSRIVDVGVPDVVTDGANFLERKYPYPEQITACGLGNGEDFQRAFPKISYLQIKPNVRLDFEDNVFDIAISNAVLEHVGSARNQIFFVKELSRIAKHVFITVRNRYFPIEHHTAIPVAHYSDSAFKFACTLLGKPIWADNANLILMTRKSLWPLSAQVDKAPCVGYTGLLLGPFSSNLFLALHECVTPSPS
jgi:hypothetical protein